MSACLIGASYTLSVKQKNYLRLRHLIVNLHLPLVCQLLLQFDFAVFLLFLRFWLVQLRSHQILTCFFFLLFGRTVEFPKFMLAFLVAVLISWFRWSRVFFVLIIFCILYCSPLVIWFFLTRNSASASVFTFLYLFCLCLFSVLLLLLLLLLCFLSCLGFLSTGTLQDSVVVLLRYQPLFVSKMLTDFCFLGVVFP